MTRMDSDRLRHWWFIGILVIVALAINVFFWERGTQRQRQAEQNETAQKATQYAEQARLREIRDAEEAHQKAIIDAEEEHSRFVTRYLNPGFSRTPGVKMIALVVTVENKKSDGPVPVALAAHLKTITVDLLPSLFTPEFVSDGLFIQILDGSSEPVRKLELAKIIDEMVLARESVNYVTNDASLDNAITANVRLEVTRIPVIASQESRTWTLSVNGLGFSPADARLLAEKLLVWEIENDTKMMTGP